MSDRIVFIDSHINNYQSLIAQLPDGAEAIVLDAQRNGIEQILAALQGKANLTAIDILSHGSPGTITLGSGILNNGNIDDYAEQLAQIGRHLKDGGDILLYGCEVAKGEAGQAFIEQLSLLTGADVAASTNLTGAAGLGGDWLLAAQVGAIQTSAMQLSYDDILATYTGDSGDNTLTGTPDDDTFTGNGGNDTLVGGGGKDTAVFAGNHNDYQISLDATLTNLTVRDVNPVDGDDGTDTLIGTMKLQFADGLFTANVVVGGELQVNTYTTMNQKKPAIAALPDGGFVVNWVSTFQDGGTPGIYAQRYAASGQKIGGEFKISSTQGTAKDSPIIAALSDGGFVSSWQSLNQDDSGNGIYAQRYAADGQKTGGEFLVNTTTANEQKFPIIAALPDGGFVVSWQSANQDGSLNGIYAQRYAADGQKTGDEFLINTFTQNDQTEPAIAALSDGGFVASWQSLNQDGSGNGIYAQRYATDGQKTGGEFLVNTTTANEQKFPVIAALLDGGFVASWQSLNQDSSGNGIYAQRYAADSQKIGSEFRVNTTTALSQEFSAITALSDGGFVVSWMSYNQDGSNWGIYAQRYAVDGQKTGGEFRVNTATTDIQWYPTIAALTDGGFVMSWESNLQDGSGAGVYMQRYDANGNAVETVIELTPFNTAPIGKASALLPDGIEDNTYDVSENSLLEGFSTGGDPMRVENLLVLDGHGSVTDNGDGTFTIVPAADYNGLVTLRYDVVNSASNQGVPATQTFTLAVVNDVPSFTKGTNQTINEDSGSQTVTGWATGISKGAIDENGQTVTFTATNDNNALFAVQPSIDAIGNLTYTPSANVNGTAMVTVSLQDSGGTANGGNDTSASQTFTITVNPINDAPQTGSAALLPGGTEDSDYAVTASSLLSGWTDADGDTLSIQNLIADHGTVIDNGSGNFTIKPQTNFNGLVMLSYEVTDATVTESATLGFNLVAVNDAPQLTGTAATLADGTENTSYTVLTSALLAGWSDIEGDSLSVHNLAADHGTVSNNGDGSYTIQPDANYNGPLLLSYDVSDSISNTPAMLQVNLNASANHAPVLNAALRNIVIWYDSSGFSYIASSSFSDPDGDSLSFSASLTNGDPLPAWLQIDATTGVIFVKPNFNDLGTYAINITATDMHGASVSGQTTAAVTAFGAGQLLVSTNGDDILQGAVSSTDTATYAYSPGPVAVSLANLAAQDTGHGIDTLINVEHLIGSAANDTLTGNDWGNVLDGGAGADRLIGGKGNDGYVIDSLGDLIIEAPGGGSDNVLALISIPLLHNYVENVFLLGSANLNAHGNILSNNLVGNSGDNVLDGKSGKDILRGGAGNDTYVVDSTGDNVIENANEGIDTVQSTTFFALGSNIENLTLLQNLAINGLGNSLDNTLTGSGGNNTLNGMEGNDTLSGGNGNDILIGGVGTDRMTGGTGADTFRFATLTDSGNGVSRDVIIGFSRIEADKIDVSGIDANSVTSKNDGFAWNSGAAFTAAGQLHYFYDNINNVTIVEGNVDAALTADFQIQLTGNVGFLAATDFVL